MASILGCIDSRAAPEVGLKSYSIKPSVAASKAAGNRNSKNNAFVSDVTELNVKDAVQTIHSKSTTLKDLEAKGQIKIVGAVYDTGNGKVSWQRRTRRPGQRLSSQELC